MKDNNNTKMQHCVVMRDGELLKVIEFSVLVPPMTLKGYLYYRNLLNKQNHKQKL